MKIYIAGPMRGKPYFNRDLFNEAADRLRGQGLDPVSPIDLDLARCPEIFDLPGAPEGIWTDSTPQDYLRVMAEDLLILAECDGMLLLGGWPESVGASIEQKLGEHLPQVICSEQGPPLVPLLGTWGEEKKMFLRGNRWRAAATWLLKCHRRKGS